MKEYQEEEVLSGKSRPHSNGINNRRRPEKCWARRDLSGNFKKWEMIPQFNPICAVASETGGRTKAGHLYSSSSSSVLIKYRIDVIRCIERQTESLSFLSFNIPPVATCSFVATGACLHGRSSN